MSEVIPLPVLDTRVDLPNLHSVMPRWQCHKIVGGMRIIAINALPDSPDIQLVLQDEQVGIQPVIVARSWYEKHKPEVTGYYVLYEDDYTSYSPAVAFENGYHRV